MNVRFYLSHYTKTTLELGFGVKMLIFCHYVCNVVMDVTTQRYLIM